MSRNVSAAARRALYASQTGEVFLILLAITHADLATPIYLSSDMVDTVYGGNTYIAMPFTVSLPDDRDDQISKATLSIDNIDRSIVAAVRSIHSAATVSLLIVMAGSPPSLEAGPFEFRLSGVSHDAFTVDGSLGYEEDFLNTAFPADDFTPQNTPGLFA